MTQPVFDPALIQETFARTRPLGVPVLMGVMPLLSSKNAEYLHNEVPGIVIPDPIRERLRNKEPADALMEGVEVARELIEAVLERFTGIYLITPFMRFDVTAGLTQYIRAQHRGLPATTGSSLQA
jgi:homocysteine S-methyltransferase